MTATHHRPAADLMVEMIAADLAPELRHRPWDTPGAMAQALDRGTVQTPALQLIDDHLAKVAAGDIDRLIINMPPQEGKALALDTPIATPTGWTTMGDLQVGDQVFDRHGRPCAVTWVSPTWTGRDCYTVTTGDGEKITADAAHEWVARLDRRRGERVVETTVLAKARGKHAQIIGLADLDLPAAADLPVDPYVLGAWLGDGSSRAAAITVADDEIVERIRDAGVPCRKGRAKYAWSLTPAGATGCSPIRRALVDLGVWGNKHIPAVYLRGSHKQRLALLQGLVDTDGHVTVKGQVEFTSTSRPLAEGVRELVYTLGAKAVLTEGRATIDGRDCGTKYRVRFYLAGAAHIMRKAERCKDSSVARIRYVTAEPCPSVPTRCIEVDSPDHTYLAGRTFLPTHNSERTSRRFPLWMLHRDPNLRIAIVSFGHDVARRWGRRIRDDLRANPDLGLTLSESTQAQHEFELLGYRGGVVCVGIKGGLTSRPVDLLIIDDPYKNADDADSTAWQDTVREFWTEVALPRLAPGAPVVIIQTRWREDDLSGWLATGENAAEWTVLNIPAQADHDPDKGETDPLGRKPGEFLESARGRTSGDWEKKRREVGSRGWNALYQGRPAPAEGVIFHRAWWQEYDQPQWVENENGVRTVLGFDDLLTSWDMTFKDTEGTDFVCGQVWGRRGADAYLLDQVHARMDFPETCRQVRQLAAKWPQALLKLVEDKANGSAVIAQLRHTVPGIVPEEPQGSKTARAVAVAPLVEARNVYLPSPELAPWVGDLIEECAGFPHAKHDDRVDALSQGLNRLILQPLLPDDDTYEPQEFDFADSRGYWGSPV